MTILEAKIARIIKKAFKQLPDTSEQLYLSVKGQDLETWGYQQKGRVVSHKGMTPLHWDADKSLLVIELTSLLSELAHCAWGIGLLKGCQLFGKEDFKQILAIWGQCHAFKGKASAISQSYYENIIYESNYLQRPEGLSHLSYFNELAKRQNRNKSLSETMEELHQDIAFLKSIRRPKQLKLGNKIAKHLSRKMTVQLLAKASVGHLPVIGSTIHHAVNIWLLEGVVEAAGVYYGRAVW